VVGRRVDGYHDLESVVAFADCADRLTLTAGPELKLKTIGRWRRRARNRDNLVLKAARLWLTACPVSRLGNSPSKGLAVAAGIARLGRRRRRVAAAGAAQRSSLDDARVRKVRACRPAPMCRVCLASYACDMTAVGEILLPLQSCPELAPAAFR